MAAYLGFLAVGSVTRRAFYLFPQGYVATGASGRVSRVTKWEDVGGITGVGPGYHLHVQVPFGKLRVVCRIDHHFGRPIKFTEPADRMVLAPLAEELRARAVDQPR